MPLDAIEQGNHFGQTRNHAVAGDERGDRRSSLPQQHRVAAVVDVELGDEIREPLVADERGGQTARECGSLGNESITVPEPACED